MKEILKQGREGWVVNSQMFLFFRVSLALLKNATKQKNTVKDGNGEIDQGEMEEVFSKLCRIVNCEQQEVDDQLL